MFMFTLGMGNYLVIVRIVIILVGVSSDCQ